MSSSDDAGDDESDNNIASNQPVRAKRKRGPYDLYEKLGAENIQYLVDKNVIFRTVERNQWLVSKSHYYRLVTKLARLRKQDEIDQRNWEAAQAKRKPENKRKRRRESSSSASAKSDESVVNPAAYFQPLTDEQAAELIVEDREDDEASSTSLAASVSLDVDDETAAAAAAETSFTAAAADAYSEMAVPDEDDNYSSSNEDDEIMINRQTKSVLLKFLEERVQAEREEESSSSSDDWDGDSALNKTNKPAVADPQAKSRPVLTVEFERPGVPAGEVIIADESSSSSTDEEGELPSVPENELIGNNQFAGDALFAEAGNTDAASVDTAQQLYIQQKQMGRGRSNKSMQTLLKLQVAARIQFIKQQPRGLNWTNLMKHVGLLLDMTQVDMTVVLQLLKASQLDPKLAQLPETAKSLMEPKRAIMKAARLQYQPIPVGLTGDYAHYGLIEGLIGMSIGTICKNNRYLLDKLVEKRRRMFGASILNLNDSKIPNHALFLKFERLKQRMLRFRQKKIAKFKAANILGGN
jgi:hypothetical protein